MALHDAATALVDLLLPAVCPGCRVRPGPRLCDACQEGLPRLRHPCPGCGRPRWRPDEPCPACNGDGLPGFRRVLVTWAYRDLIATLVHRAKAAEDAAAVATLCRLLPACTPADTVVAVPPSPDGRRSRHLASVLAASVARSAGLPLRRLLRCQRLAAEQHRLGLRDRRRNVDGLFSCPAGASGHIVLVDDLLTSGATACEAARCLRRSGAADISLLVLARTPRADEPPDLQDDRNTPDRDGKTGCLGQSTGTTPRAACSDKGLC